MKVGLDKAPTILPRPPLNSAPRAGCQDCFTPAPDQPEVYTKVRENSAYDLFGHRFLELARTDYPDLPPFASEGLAALQAAVWRATERGLQDSPERPLQWAFQAIREITTEADRRRIDQKLLSQTDSASPEQHENGVAIRLDQTGTVKTGCAALATIVLNYRLVRGSLDYDFTKGHELCHIEHQDPLGWIGYEELLFLLGRPAPSDLEQAARRLRHSQELRADRAGVRRAVEAGHPASEILARAKRLYTHPETEHYPAGAVRVWNIEQTLKSL